MLSAGLSQEIAPACPRSTASEGLKKLHEVAAFTPDYDFKLKLVLKCHLTLIDYEDRTMGSAEA